jgi:glucose/arabinose dehydrogenase
MNASLKTLGHWAIVAVILLLSSSATALPEGMIVEDFIEGLQFPVSLAPTSNGDILVAEKFGAVRLIRSGELLEQPIASFDVTTENEAGFIGITPMPDYADTGEFLALYTPEEPLDKIFVSHMQVDGDRARVLEERWLEFPSRPTTDRHYAGNLRFSSDGHLFVTLGDLREREWAQDTTNLPGSVLRYNADGTVPNDNPFGNAIYAYGMRNPFDLAFDADGRLYTSENGGDANDEVNHIEAGQNYGWPLVQGYCDNFPIHEPCDDADLFTPPAFEFRTINGPTGLMIYTGEMFPELSGHLLVSGWHSAAVHRLAPGDDPTTLEHLSPLYKPQGELGVTDLEQANDGAVLVLLAGREGGEIKRIVAAGETVSDPPADQDQTEGGCSTTREQSPVGAGWLLMVLMLSTHLIRIRRR